VKRLDDDTCSVKRFFYQRERGREDCQIVREGRSGGGKGGKRKKNREKGRLGTRSDVNNYSKLWPKKKQNQSPPPDRKRREGKSKEKRKDKVDLLTLPHI